MEDKLSSDESDLCMLSDFIERRKNWDQRDEARLADYLQHLSNKITQGAKSMLNELDDLVASIDDTAVQIANVNNEFQLLADKQFIENKVQEEDETVQIKVEKPVARETNNADTLVNNFKEALKNSFNAIDSHFERVTVVVSDSDDDDDELKHEETVLRPRTFYKKLNLPSLCGNTQSEIAVDSAMSSDSDSVVEHPSNAFKDEESLLSNDIPEEDNHSVIEQNIIHNPSLKSVDTYSNMFEPEKCKPKTVPTFADNDNDDLFSPPPLPNDYEEDDIENDYNIFGNSSNMYGERTLWDDDDDNFPNEPPLPIHSDEPPQQVIKSNIQKKAEVPNIQQSLNAELQKRFQKDVHVSSTSDNLFVEPPSYQLPKGAINILGGTDIKPFTANPDQESKQVTISQISKNVSKTIKNTSVEDAYNSNKLFNTSSKSSIISASKDLKKNSQPLEKQSLFQQDSDDEDLFIEKKPIVIPVSKPDIPKQKEKSAINIKSQRTIFSDSDSDDEFINSKSTYQTGTSHTSVDNSSIRHLNSSSEDDLFNIKPINNKSFLKQKSTLFSSSVHDEALNESKQVNNAIEQKSKSPIENKNTKEVLNQNTVDNLTKNNLKESNFSTNNTIISKNSVLNNKASNENIMEPLPKNNSTIKSSNSQHEKKLNNLFSSDEDDFDDDMFLNVNKLNNRNIIKKNQTIYDSDELIQTNELYESKVKMFYSSDDDIFNTNKSNNNLISPKTNKLPDSEEIKSTEYLDKMNSTEKNNADKNNKNIFSLLSDDDEDEDENYLSFNSNSDRSMNISNIHNLEENSKAMSLSSEEFLSPQTDLKNENIYHNSSFENLLNKQNQNLICEEEIDTPSNEILPIFKKASVQDNKSSIFSNSDDDDEQQLRFDSDTNNENSKKGIEEIPPTSYSSFENVFDIKNQDKLDDKNEDTINNDALFTSTENTSKHNQSFMVSSSEDEDQMSFDSNVHSKKTKMETKNIHQVSNLSFENVLANKNQVMVNEKNTDTTNNETFTSTEKSSQINQSSIFSNSDDDEQQLKFDSDIKNGNIKKEMEEIPPTLNSSFKNVFDIKNQDKLDDKNEDTINNDTLFTSTENTSKYNQSFMVSSSEDEDQISFDSNVHSKKTKMETKNIHQVSNSLFENVLDNKNQDMINEKSTDTTNDETFTSNENSSQINQSSIFSNSDDDEKQLSFDSDINNRDTINKTKLIHPSSESKTDLKESFNDSTDGSSFSTSNSRDEQTKKLPGKLNKNAGAFINIAGLFPTSKKTSKLSAMPKSASLDEKCDESLPTSGTKLFSAGKERAKIQVKRRPQSRKARVAAARMSSIDIDHKSNFQVSSRLFGSTSDLVAYQSSPILNATDFPSKLQNKIQGQSNNKLIVTNDDQMYEGSKKTETNYKLKNQTVLDLFDDDSIEELKKQNIHKDNKEKIFDEKPSECKLVHKEYAENKSSFKQVKGMETCPTVKELKENESASTQNTQLSRKSNSLFVDDDDLFSLKTEKVKKISSNLFNSDDECEFNQNFSKKTSLKTHSIFSDDSDDDLFSSTSKSSTISSSVQKSSVKLSQQQTRSSADGYVKLAAESVAINPLESKKT